MYNLPFTLSLAVTFISTLESNGNLVFTSNLVGIPFISPSIAPAINRFSHILSLVLNQIYYPKEDRVLAILGGQQAHPNHFWRTGLTWAIDVWSRQLFGQTSRGFT